MMKVTVTPPPKPKATITVSMDEGDAVLLRRAIESVSHRFDSGFVLTDLLSELKAAGV